MNDQSPVVVGIDGSEEPKLAVRWALDEARAQHLPVRLVYAFGGALTYGSMAMYGNLPQPNIDTVRVAARKILADAARDAAEMAPDVELSTDAYDGDPAPVLLAESKHASTVVLGSRRLGAAGSALLGSVGNAVSARASCPVVVVRGPAGDPAERAAVVVGVDAREDSPAVLAYAFGYASRHDAPLRAVLCWHVDLLAEIMWSPTPPAPPKAEAWLSEALAGWREKYPDVTVHGGVVRERAVAGLVAESAAQRLLVVGSHGRHALAGTLLGSVSQGVLHHATCPVAVVPLHSD
ncbi:MAG: universal stress protein [Jatrophihabitantaceae bacterium]